MKEYKIVCFYDFDGTLIPDTMFHPILANYGIDANAFFEECDLFQKILTDDGLQIDGEHCYMNIFMKYINEKKLPPFMNKDLRKLGEGITFFPGVVDYFKRSKERINQEFGHQGIKLEHHIVSTGNRQIILGTEIAPYVDQVIASEFIEGSYLGLPQLSLASISSAIGPNLKPLHFFSVNKGADVDPSINLQRKMRMDHRKVPFTRMVYVADGFTDVPPFAILSDRDGLCVGVYNPRIAGSLETGTKLVTEGRVHKLVEANYTKESDLSHILEGQFKRSALEIILKKSQIELPF
ncbi:hypothetical protein COV12_03420 [Candidatus Woesearchaeota archaeon CG10_big_fil_rev_8_21_14_0_10_32_24]|nr:MAG: hypothetical protein COV12_03420 [Candidatus Woesearchaeota archaeon CG10_big_fil_rev_8_21_14_0_10_32_24]